MIIESDGTGTHFRLEGSPLLVPAEVGWVVRFRGGAEHFLPAREYRRTPQNDPPASHVVTFARWDACEMRFDLGFVEFTTVSRTRPHPCPSCDCEGSAYRVVPEDVPSLVEP